MRVATEEAWRITKTKLTCPCFHGDGDDVNSDFTKHDNTEKNGGLGVCVLVGWLLVTHRDRHMDDLQNYRVNVTKREYISSSPTTSFLVYTLMMRWL